MILIIKIDINRRTKTADHIHTCTGRAEAGYPVSGQTLIRELLLAGFCLLLSYPVPYACICYPSLILTIALKIINFILSSVLPYISVMLPK